MTEQTFYGKLLAMVLVNISEQNMHPTQAFADAAWRANPKLSPSAYRSVLGLTVSKVAVNCFEKPAKIAKWLNAGLNLLVMEQANVANVAKAIKLWGGDRAGLVLGLVTDEVEPKIIQKIIETWGSLDVVWLCNFTPAVCELLENLVAEGTLGAYGMVEENGLQQAVQMADVAAEKVYGRKKRSGFRAFMGAVGIGNTELLLEPCITHKKEEIAAIEYAARMGWLVVASHVRYVQFSSQAIDAAALPVRPDRKALAVVHALANAEDAVKKQWPHRDGLPVFAITPFLLEGLLPWEHPDEATMWQEKIWPQLQQDLAVHPEVLTAWHSLLPYIANIAAVQAFQNARMLDESLQAAIAGWDGQSGLSILAGLVGSVPGIASVWEEALTLAEALEVMQRPDVPDPAYFL